MAKRIPAYRQAQIEIKRFIEEHRLGAGDALPPEGQLAERLGFSRPSLREGMKALESLGIVESRHGEGIFVSPFSFDAILENLPYSIVANGKSAVDLLQVRASLEIGVLCQVADLLTDEDRQQLRAYADDMLVCAQQGLSFERQGKDFHALLFSRLGNSLVQRLIDLFWDLFERINASHRFNPGEWSLEENAIGHLRMVDMLDRGDKPALVEAYQAYFQNLAHLIDGLAPTTPATPSLDAVMASTVDTQSAPRKKRPSS